MGSKTVVMNPKSETEPKHHSLGIQSDIAFSEAALKNRKIAGHEATTVVIDEPDSAVNSPVKMRPSLRVIR